MTDRRVVIIEPNAPVPVYHAFENARFDPTTGAATSWVMRCGAADSLFGVNQIRIEHAEQFARPCSRCFRGTLPGQPPAPAEVALIELYRYVQNELEHTPFETPIEDYVITPAARVAARAAWARAEKAATGG